MLSEMKVLIKDVNLRNWRNCAIINRQIKDHILNTFPYVLIMFTARDSLSRRIREINSSNSLRCQRGQRRKWQGRNCFSFRDSLQFGADQSAIKTRLHGLLASEQTDQSSKQDGAVFTLIYLLPCFMFTFLHRLGFATLFMSILPMHARAHAYILRRNMSLIRCIRNSFSFISLCNKHFVN